MGNKWWVGKHRKDWKIIIRLTGVDAFVGATVLTDLTLLVDLDDLVGNCSSGEWWAISQRKGVSQNCINWLKGKSIHQDATHRSHGRGSRNCRGSIPSVGRRRTAAVWRVGTSQLGWISWCWLDGGNSGILGWIVVGWNTGQLAVSEETHAFVTLCTIGTCPLNNLSSNVTSQIVLIHKLHTTGGAIRRSGRSHCARACERSHTGENVSSLIDQNSRPSRCHGTHVNSWHLQQLTVSNKSKKRC